MSDNTDTDSSCMLAISKLTAWPAGWPPARSLARWPVTDPSNAGSPEHRRNKCNNQWRSKLQLEHKQVLPVTITIYREPLKYGWIRYGPMYDLWPGALLTTSGNAAVKQPSQCTTTKNEKLNIFSTRNTILTVWYQQAHSHSNTPT